MASNDLSGFSVGPIDTPIVFTGAEEAARVLGELSQKLVDLAPHIATAVTEVRGFAVAAERQAAVAVHNLTERMKTLGEEGQRTGRNIAEFAQRAGGAAREVANFARMIHNELLQSLADTIARTADSTAHFAQLGAMLGPQGAVVGAIIGALLPAVQQLVNAEDSARRAAAAHEAQLRRNIRTIGEYVGELQRARAAASQTERLTRGLGSVDEQTADIQRLRDQQAALVAQEEAARRRYMDVLADTSASEERRQAAEDAYQEVVGLRVSGEQFIAEALERQAQAQEEIAALQAEDAATLQQELVDAAKRTQEAEEASLTHTRTGGDGGAAAREREAAEERSWLEDMESDARVAADELARVNSEAEKLRETLAGQREVERAAHEEFVEHQHEKIAMIAERIQREDALLEHDARVQRERIAESREQTKDFAQVVGSTTSMFVDALTQTIAGTKSAEEAFKGLLKGFLEMISQQATLKAIFEFGEAIASAARQDWGGFAGHLAAGVAFTAVAVATGVGAAALSPPPAPTGPAEPQQSQNQGPAKGDVVVNLNGGTITAGTYAQLGRTLRNTITRAAQLGL